MSFAEKSLELRKDARRFILAWIKPSILAEDAARQELNTTLRQHWPNDPFHAYELVHEHWDPKRHDTPPTPAAPSGHFVVFIDTAFDVDWIYDGVLQGKQAECVSIAESVGARRCQHLPREQVLEFRRLIGQAIVSAFQDNEKCSSQLSTEAAQFLKDRTTEQSRAWTLMSAHCLVLLIALILGTSFSQARDKHFELWVAASGGVVGAYLSVVQKAGRGEWDAASGLNLHILEVLTKIVAGALFGGISYAISQSVHAPPSLKAITPDSFSIFLFGLAAGLFERLIPKMVSKYAEVYEKKGQS